MYKLYIIITFFQNFLGLIIIFLILFNNNKNIDIYNKYNNKSYLNFLNYNEYYNFFFKLTGSIIIIFLLLTIFSIYLNNKVFVKILNN